MTTPTVLADDRTAPRHSPSKGSASGRRLAALARAELILLVRNRSAIFLALVLPVVMIFSIRASLQQIDLAGTGLSIAGAALTGGIGIVLVQVVYMNLVTGYVTRREELVLKRLRTGEVTDREILTATALPSVALALLQCVLLVVAGAIAFDLTAPKRPELFLLGLLVGFVMMAALAAATLRDDPYGPDLAAHHVAAVLRLPLRLRDLRPAGRLPGPAGLGARTAAADRGDEPRTARLARQRGDR